MSCITFSEGSYAVTKSKKRAYEEDTTENVAGEMQKMLECFGGMHLLVIIMSTKAVPFKAPLKQEKSFKKDRANAKMFFVVLKWSKKMFR